MTTNADAHVKDGGRHWGPFSGRHLTIMFVAIVIGAIVIPGTAWAAVTFTNVAITDPGGVNRAVVDSGGNLHVKSGPMAPVVNVDSSGRSAFNATLFVKFTDGSPFGSNPSITVPAGKRFVIRDVNIAANVPTGQKLPNLVINISDGTAHTFSHSFPIESMGAEPVGGGDSLVSNNPTVLYAGAGTQVNAVAIRSANTGAGTVTFTLSGDLITCSTAPTVCSAAEALNP